MYKSLLKTIQKSDRQDKSNHPIHNRKSHFIFSAENPYHPAKLNLGHDKTIKLLKDKGYDVEELKGKYGSEEKSILVKNPPRKAIKELMKLSSDLGQDSSIISNGYTHELHYHHGENAGKHHKGQGTATHRKAPEDFYSTLEDGTHFTHNLDFDKFYESKDSDHDEISQKHPLNNSYDHLNLIHFSNKTGLKSIDPEHEGTGHRGDNFKTGKSLTRQSQYYLEGIEPEGKVSRNSKKKYVVPLKGMKVYDKGNDPDGFWSKLKEKVNNRSSTTEQLDQEYIKSIKDAGYHGFFMNSPRNSYDFQNHTVHLFHPQTPVSEYDVHPKDFKETSSKNFHDEEIGLEKPQKEESDINPNFTHRRMFKNEEDDLFKNEVKINPEHGRMIASEYEKMKHDPDHPSVKSAYDALIGETTKQFHSIMGSGIKISRMKPGMENPYKNSKELHHDIKHNKHMWYYPTNQGFGSNPKENNNHPMLRRTGVHHDDNELLANDMFRIVHDINGHHLGGESGFGAKGEHRAFNAHKKMYSAEAQKALATETLGQNSWVNFGPHGEHNRANPDQTKYADQKAGLLPDHIINGNWHGPDEKLNKSEWKQKYSYILQADLEKGAASKFLAGAAGTLALTYGAHEMGHDSASRQPVSVEPNYSITREAPHKEDDYDRQIREARKNHFMQHADSDKNKHLDHQKTTEIIQKDPSLNQKYGHLSTNPFETSQTMAKDKELRNTVHGKYFDHLYKKFGGNLSHIAHAWKYGPINTRKYIESGKSTKDHPAVKRFYNY